MSILSDLENELRRAAARPRRRWWSASRGAVLVTGFVLVGGAAGAAGLGLVAADPDAQAHVDQEIPTAITGQPVRNGTLAPVRAPDPDGGPPWGIRVTSTSRGAACVQVGRVVDDQLVVLGRDGAFDDDGRAHVVPVGRDICVPTAADGTPLLRSRTAITTSSGLERCRDRCPAGAHRALRWGFLGPQATAASYRTAAGRTTDQPIAPGGVGAYLFVQRLLDDRAGRFAAIQRPGTVTATFAGGGTKTVTGPGRIRVIPGVEPPTPDRDRGPLDASFSVPRSRSASARVRFRAPVDALRYPTAFRAYVETVRRPGRAASDCQGTGTTDPDEGQGTVTPPIRKGETATLVVRPPKRARHRRRAWCPGTHRVRLIQIGGSARGSITLATRTFVVR